MSDKTKESSGKNEAAAVSGRNFAMARANSRVAAVGALIGALSCLFGVVASAFISRARNMVAAVPIGQTWDLPAVHWMSAVNRYEEDAKPIHVALKYVRGLYEVDPIDFTTVQAAGESRMVSNRVAELLVYTVPGTKENFKVAMTIEKSQSLYKIYNESKAIKRFLVSDIMVSQPPLPILRIELLGRFVIFSPDGRRPLPAEDLGYKSITLYLTPDAPIFDRSGDNTPRNSAEEAKQKKDAAEKGKDEEGDSFLGLQTGGDSDKLLNDLVKSAPRGVNPEGWYVIRSQIRTLTKDDLNDIRQIRLDSGMKEFGL